MRFLAIACVLISHSVCVNTAQDAKSVTHGDPVTVVYKQVSKAEVFQPAMAAPGTAPGLVLISDSTGLDDFLRQRAAEFAAQGFLVVVMDPGLSLPTIKPDTPHERAVRYIGGAVGYLNNWMKYPGKIVLIGFGSGGSLALDFAMSENSVRGVVVNYATLPAGDPLLSNIHAKLLLSQAAQDTSTTKEQDDRFRTDAQALHLSMDMKVYPHAHHGFDRKGEESYDAVAAANANARTLLFLKAVTR